MIKKVRNRSKKVAARTATKGHKLLRTGSMHQKGRPQPKLKPATAYKYAIDIVPLAILTVDDALKVSGVNRVFEEIFGYSNRQIVGTKITDLLHPEELVKGEHRLRRALRMNAVAFHEEFSWLRRDGSSFVGRIFLSSFSPNERPNGRGAICWIEDVTRIRETESDLKRSEELLARAEQIAKLGRWEWNVETRRGWWSEGVYQILATSPQETRANIEELFRSADPLDRVRLNASVEQLTHRDSLPEPIEFRLLLPGKGIRLILLSTDVVRDGRGRVKTIRGTIQDITERRELESLLQQSQKMEVVGLLAGGIAHDFNNLLTVIRGQCELMLRKMDASNPARQEAESIERAADHAQRLTGQLLAFGRKQVMEPRVLDLNKEIARMTEVLSRLIGENIEFVVEMDPNLGHVRADAVQIEQVVMNLAINARDAMPIGGRLTIQTANVLSDGEVARSNEKIPPGR